MYRIKKHVFIAASILTLAASSAHAQFEFIRDLTTSFRDFVKEAIESARLPQPQTGPRPNQYTAVVGNWFDKNAFITSVAQDPEYQRYSYSWNGQIIGRINELGEYIFRADNGCQITGVITPYASDTMWSLLTQTTSCPFAHLNHRMSGRISKEGNVLTLRLDDPPMATGRKLSYTMKAVMLQY